MAFPTVAAADSKSGTQTSNSTSWTGTFPTNIAVDDLLILFVSCDGASTSASATGFSAIININSGATGGTLLMKKAAGTETGTFTITISASEQGCWRCIRIPAATWFAGTITAADTSTDSYESSGSAATGTTNAPNPPSVNPVDWDVEDTLWIAWCGWDSTPTMSTFPTNYTQEDHTTAGGHTATSGGAGGAGLAVAYRQNAVASEDPSAFGLSGADNWVAMTLAIRPAAAAAAGNPPYTNPYPPLLAQ